MKQNRKQKQKQKRKQKHEQLWQRVVLASMLVCIVTACGKEARQPEKVPPAVSVYIVGTEEVGEYFEFIARTEAYQSADLRTRVEGILVQRLFEEGAFVEEDQLLFRIDPERIQGLLKPGRGGPCQQAGRCRKR